MSAGPLVPVPRDRRPLVLLAWLWACGPQVELGTDTENGSTGTSGPTTDPTGGPTTNATTVGPGTDPTVDPDEGTSGPMPTERAVDILFVVDNSGSMGEEQAKLAIAIDTLVAALDEAVPPVDYRIAVTTSDNGNPWCGTTGPEAGQLRATSCRSRQSEFVFNGAVVVDVTQQACLDVCSLETLDIDDGKPWIDVHRSTGTTNVGDAVVDNLRCMLPQGIDGCGFESQLESLWKSIRRSQTDSDPAYGFHRDTALLATIIVTDEVDCSYNNEWETIFLPDGNRVFWSDPMSASPTSAVCWNAGVACRGAGVYECHAVNLDVNGSEVADADADADAVLRPVARYTDELLLLGAYAFAIDGVALDGSVVYADSLGDPQFQNDYGIGPGCETDDGRAVPPVRIHEMTATVSDSVHESSVCAAGFEDGLATFAQGILSRLP
jgi:hypothetical protein